MRAVGAAGAGFVVVSGDVRVAGLARDAVFIDVLPD